MAAAAMVETVAMEEGMAEVAEMAVKTGLLEQRQGWRPRLHVRRRPVR